MNIPKKVRIAGVDYEIVYDNALNANGRMAYGHIDYEKSKIELNKEIVEEPHLLGTIIHEILHGIIHHFNVGGMEDEEQVVSEMSQGLYQVISDNPHLFAKNSKE